MADYPSKHHTGKGHPHVRPYYLHTEESPVYLPRAVTPSTRRGCAEIVGDPYYKTVPLPRLQSRAQGYTPSSQNKDTKDTFPSVAIAAHASQAQRTPRTDGRRYTDYRNLFDHFTPKVLVN